MKIMVSDIDWDYPGRNDGSLRPDSLPGEVVIDDPILVVNLAAGTDGYEDAVAEYLSDTYGYCVCGFTAELEGVGDA